MPEAMRTYDILEPVDNADESLNKLTQIFAPLYTASWVAEKSKLYGDPPYNMNVGVFAGMWMSKAMRIFIGYRDMKPAGYILGILFRPFTHQRNIFQVDDWFAPDDPELLHGMFNYMQDALRFMGVDELHISLGPHDQMPPIGARWGEARQTRTVQFIKR